MRKDRCGNKDLEFFSSNSLKSQNTFAAANENLGIFLKNAKNKLITFSIKSSLNYGRQTLYSKNLDNLFVEKTIEDAFKVFYLFPYLIYKFINLTNLFLLQKDMAE